MLSIFPFHPDNHALNENLLSSKIPSVNYDALKITAEMWCHKCEP